MENIIASPSVLADPIEISDSKAENHLSGKSVLIQTMPLYIIL